MAKKTTKDLPSATRVFKVESPDAHKRHKTIASSAVLPYESIRQDLERQKTLLLAEMQATAGANIVQPDVASPDLGDRATVEEDQRFALRLYEREKNLVRKIEEALSRISAGVFGVCQVCGSEISLKRLKVRPVTTLCIVCKTAQEVSEVIKV